MAVEIALFLVKTFDDDAEQNLALFRHFSKPADQARWKNVQVALSLYRDMHSRHTAM